MLILQKFLTHPQLSRGAALWDAETQRFKPSNDVLPHVLKLVKEAHIIVIDDPQAKLQGQALKDVFTADARPLAPPFATCWIEVVDRTRNASPLIFATSDAHPVYRILSVVEKGSPKIRFFPESDGGAEVQFEAGASPWVSGHMLPKYLHHMRKLPMGVHPVGDEKLLIEKRAGFVSMLGALVQERSPGRYDMYTVEAMTADINDAMNSISNGASPFVSAPDKGFVFLPHSPVSASITIYKDVDPYSFRRDDKGDVRSELPISMSSLLSWLKIINDGAVATEHTSDTVRMPRLDRRHKSKPHPIRRIVRILPKREYRKEIPPLTPTGIIDWTHRWEVRGHWRKVHSVGKDRSGEYNVVGFTWVNEFVKGPEDKPLVIKTRVLHDQSSTT